MFLADKMKIRKKAFIPLKKAIDFSRQMSYYLKSLSLRTFRKRKSLMGFTLAELIIVVLIISVMTFIAVPKLAYSVIFGGKAQAETQTVAGALRHTRNLALTDANNNNSGYSFQATSTGFQIVNLKTSAVVETYTFPQNVTCTSGNFGFGPLGNGLQADGSLTVSSGSKSYTITVKSLTGMIKWQ